MPAPSDFAEAARREIRRCGNNERLYASSIGASFTAGSSFTGRLDDGTRTEGRSDRGVCVIETLQWLPQGDRLARAVEAGLIDWEPQLVLRTWREQISDDDGNSVQTVFEQKDAAGQVLGLVTVIEPVDESVGLARVVYQASR